MTITSKPPVLQRPEFTRTAVKRAATAVLAICLFVTGCETRESLTRKRTRDTERGLLRAVYLKGQKSSKLALDSRMPFYKVPGVSIAVMDRNNLEWAEAYGFRDVHSREPATADTIFEAGDLSQPVIAAAALKLAAQGRLDLDADIDTLFKSWKIPQNEFTKKTPVTVREILTHTAGFPPGSPPGFPRSGRLPTLLEILDGHDGAGSPVAGPDAVPGTRGPALRMGIRRSGEASGRHRGRAFFNRYERNRSSSSKHDEKHV